MVDAAGTSGSTYDNLGHLRTKEGPWANDTVRFAYTNTLRMSLAAQRTGAADGTLGYSYDGVSRCGSLSVPTTATFVHDPARYASAVVPPTGGRVRARAVRGIECQRDFGPKRRR